MVKIRFTQTGRTHLQMFRLVATDSRSPRDGKNLEILGTYNPHAENIDEKFIIKEDRVNHWLSVGAQPTPKVWPLLRKKGINKATALEARKARGAAANA